MKIWILKLLQSFDASKEGLSARKLSSFYAILGMATFVTINYTSKENAPIMLGIWLIFAALCLSIITVQQILDVKHEINSTINGNPS